MHRRDVLIGLGSAAAAGSFGAPALADAPARRVFRIRRAGDDIGRHILSARQTRTGFEIEIDIDIAVKVLGFTAYRYTLTNREVWEAGRLVQLDSEANDDGDRHRLSIRRGSDRLEIDGTGFSGTAPLEAATTSYYVPDFLDRRPWISTQSGKPLSVSVEPLDASGKRPFKVTGELETRLVYDRRDEWVGSEFDAGGEPAAYEIVEETGRISPLWRSA